jgi:hypothetical protein
MKEVILSIAVVLFILIGCTQEEESESPLEGAWQVVSWKAISADTVQWELGVNITGTEMKIWSDNYFNFVGRYTMDDSTQFNYGGGSYKLDGNKYEENLIYPETATVKLLLEIRNDTVIQTWPCDENWKTDKSNYYIQKLIRKD